MNEKCLKSHLWQILGQFLSIPSHYLDKNRFWSRSSKNWQFSENKVWKMTDKFFFPIKYKMLTVYGFHIDFQFWAKMSLPRDLQMDMAPPGSWNGIASWLWDFWPRFLFLIVSRHLESFKAQREQYCLPPLGLDSNSMLWRQYHVQLLYDSWATDMALLLTWITLEIASAMRLCTAFDYSFTPFGVF